MGCKLIRGETIYFIRHGGERSHELEPNWFSEVDALLPRVYSRSEDRKEVISFPSVIPIEIRTFEAS
jgi:hypothetical protein